MKIEINPSTIEEYRALNQPATVSVGTAKVCFNKVAEKLLSLKDGSKFSFEFEDGKLFYKDATNGFEVHPTGKYNIMMSWIQKIGKYQESLFKDGLMTRSFEIGEFKEGRRILNLMKK